MRVQLSSEGLTAALIKTFFGFPKAVLATGQHTFSFPLKHQLLYYTILFIHFRPFICVKKMHEKLSSKKRGGGGGSSRG